MMSESVVKLGEYKNISIPENLTGQSRDRYIVNEIMKSSDASVPESEVTERGIGMFEQFDIKLSQQGLSLDEYCKVCHTSKEKLMTEFKHHAQRQLKERKVLLRIAEIEGICANDDDYQAYLNELNKIYPLSIDEMSQIMNKREKERILEEIRLRKTIDYIEERYSVVV